MSSVWPTLAIIAVYYFIVLAGPRAMESKKPLDLKWFMVCYNLFMVVLSAYMFVEASSTMQYIWNSLCANILRVSVCLGSTKILVND